jgi:hypothetical protein
MPRTAAAASARKRSIRRRISANSDHKAASGLLIAALGVLAAHLGYGEIKRAC